MSNVSVWQVLSSELGFPTPDMTCMFFTLLWKGYSLSKSSNVMNWVRPQMRKVYKKYLQYHELEKSIILFQEAVVVWEPASRFRPPKEKNGLFRESFAGLEDSSHQKIPSVRFWAPWCLSKTGLEWQEQLKMLLHLHYEQLNLKWALEIPVFIFNVSNCWQHCRASKGWLLNGILVSPYISARRDVSSSPGDKKLEVSVVLPPACEYMWYHCLQISRAGGCGCYWYYLTVLPYQNLILFSSGNKCFMLKRENVSNSGLSLCCLVDQCNFKSCSKMVFISTEFFKYRMVVKFIPMNPPRKKKKL